MKRIVKIGIISIVVLVISIIFFIVFNDYSDKQLIKEIKNNYNTWVKTTKDKKIYELVNDKYKSIGIVSNNTVLNLDKHNIISKKDIYFKIANTDYYIDYLDLEKIKANTKDTSYDNYLSTKEITTYPTILYRDGKVVFNFEKEFNFDVLKVDNNNYYVKYLDTIYTIHSNYSVKDKETNNALKDISVLNFSDNITSSKLEEILKYLKENNYVSITLDDFKLWVDGKISLTNNSVLLITYKKLDDEKKKILSDSKYIVNDDFTDIQFTSGDSKIKIGDNTYYKYEIYNTTSLNRIGDMLKGIKEVKIDNQKIAVLNYHFFYDSNSESCNEVICISNDNFRKQLDYLKKNNFKTLTMEEFNDWMDGKITIPKKSILITIDDGAAGTFNHLPNILNEYQMNATLFLISGWWDVNKYKTSPYLQIESHGDELHHNNYCDSNGCGYKSLKLTKDEIKQDLQTSISKIGSNLAFCYPFYQTNSNLVNAVRESGFKLGFVGGNKKVAQNNNKFYIPRYIIYKNTSLDSFSKMVN